MDNETERIIAIASTCMGNRVRKTARIVSSFYDNILRPTGLHANQLNLLVPPYLAGSISINRMAEYVGLDRTTLVRNLKLLEERGLVTVKPGTDLRTRIVTLTPQGRETLLAALPLWEEAQRQVIDMLGALQSDLVKSLETLNSLEATAES
jgi:DNA-binding MarR family transcriptional regulator